MKKTFIYALSAFMACMMFVSCSDDDDYEGRIIDNPSEMPELFKGIWTGSVKDYASGKYGLMFDFTSGKLVARRFNYDNGAGEDYQSAFKYNVDKREGEVSLSLDGNLTGKWEFTMTGDSIMTGAIGRDDTLSMRYVAPNTEKWWEHDTHNTKVYGNGPSIDLDLNLQDNVSNAAPFEWLTPMGILEKVATSVLSSCVSKGFSEGLDFLFKGDDPVMGKLNEINAQLADVNRKLDDVLYILEKQDYSRAFRDRMILYKDLDAELTTIMNQMASSDGSEESQKSIMALINKFCNMQVGSAMMNHAVSAYITRLVELPPDKSNNNMGDVYDYIIFNTVAWEHDGYEPRFLLRCSDASMLARLACVTMYYWKYGDSPANEYTRQKEIDSIVKAIDDYKERCKEYDEGINFIVDNKVVKNEDYAVCQIRGAHVKFAKHKFASQDQYVPFVRYDAPTQVGKWANVSKGKQMFYSVPGFDTGVIESHSLNDDEVRRILSYYGNKKSLEEILNDNVGAVPFSHNSKNTLFLILQGGGYQESISWFDSERDIFVNKAAICNKPGTNIDYWRICRIEWKSTKWVYEETNPEREWFHAWVERY